MARDGDFIAAWSSAGLDEFSQGIYAQRFTTQPPPAKLGSEFQVNTSTNDSQTEPSVATSPNGDYIIAWTSATQDGSGLGVYAQRYNAAGVSQGAEFRVNTTTAGDQSRPSVAVDADGDFVIAWSTYEIYAQRYNSAGVAQGGEFIVNTYTTANQIGPTVAMDAVGNFVVAWTSIGQDGDNGGVYAQRYDASGLAQGGEFQVSQFTTGSQGGPKVANDALGNFVITWNSPQDGSGFGIYARRYDAAGDAQGGEFQVNTYTTGDIYYQTIAMDADGDFVIAWGDQLQDGDWFGIYARRFDAAGLPKGGEFQANTYTTSVQWQPKVAMDADGDFSFVWNSNAQDGSSYGIYGQQYNSAGIRVGPEFRVNTYTTGGQTFPTAAMDQDGDLIVTWQSAGQDGSGTGIYAQHFQSANPNTAPVLETNAGLTLDEGVTTAITNSILNTTDAEQSTDEIVYTVLQLPVNGVLNIDGNPLALNGSFTQEDLDNNLITYAHNGSETTTDEFDFVVADGVNFLTQETFSITVTPVSDAPVLQTNAGVTVNEGQEATILAAALNSTDVDNPAAEIIYEITSLPASGELKKDGVTLTLNETFVETQIGYGFITYVHDGSETSIDSFDFTVTDGTTTLSEATFNISINPVNDAPVVQTNTGLTLDEGIENNISAAELNTSDAENVSASITYTVTTLPLHGALQKSGTTLLLNGTFTQADINNNLVSFEHDGSESISDSFKFTVSDGSTTLSEATFNITINPVNDAPAFAVNAGVTIGEGDEITVSAVLLSATDADTAEDLINFQVTALPVNGELRMNGITLPLNATFTQADISTLLIVYDHNGGESTVDSFNVTVTDGNETAGPASFFITITPVNDPPTPSVNGSLNLGEGSESNITDASLVTTDVDNAPGTIAYTVTSLPVHGQVRKNGVGMLVSDTFTQADLNNVIVISYAHDGGEASTDSFNFTVSDGIATLPENTYNITINNVNDALILAVNETLTVDEGANATISSTLLSATDVDNAPGTIIYTVTMLPSYGDLQNDGLSIPLNGTFTQADVNNGLVTFTHDGSETNADNFSFIVNDGFVFLPGTFFISVVPVSDAPVLSINTGLTVNEADEGFITSSVLSTTDVDNNSGSIIYTVTELPLHGQLMKLGSQLALNDTFTQQQIQASAITFFHDGSETTGDSFKFTVSDGTTTLPEAIFNIAISLVNDAPVLATNAGLTVNEGDEVALSTSVLNTTDGDTNEITIQYTVTELPLHGEIKILGIPITVNGVFSQADVDDGLVTYQHDAGETISDSFKFDVSDGTTTLSQYAFNITVNPVNDDPVLSVNAGVTVDEGGEVSIYAGVLSTSDDDANFESIVYTLSQEPAHGMLLRNGIEVEANDTFTQLDINDFQITFEHDGGETTSDSFKFTVTDGVTALPEATFNIDVIPANDSPVVSINGGTTIGEGSETVISLTELNSTDSDNADDEIRYVVTVLPLNGELWRSGTVISLNDSFTQANLENGTVIFIHDGSESTSDSFNFRVEDDAATTAEQTFNITVTPSNDALLITTNEALTLDEGASATIGSAALSTTDEDNTADEVSYQISAAPLNGSLLKNTVVLTTSDVFTQQDVNDNIISYQHDGSETTGDSFTFAVTDGAYAMTGSFLIIVNPVTDGLLAQTIDFAALGDKIDGDAAFTLTAPTSSGLAVTFTIVSGPATINGNSLTITGPGPITVRASQAGDGAYDPAPDVDQTFCANPKKATITVQDNDTATPKLVSSAANGNQWFKGNQPLEGQTNSILTVTEQGIYKVQVTVGGCVGEMSSERALVVTGGVVNFSNEIVLSPNPSADFVTIDGLSGGASETTVTDMSGRKQHLAIQREGTKLVLDARGLSRGTYLISVRDGANIHRLKFIKN